MMIRPAPQISVILFLLAASISGCATHTPAPIIQPTNAPEAASPSPTPETQPDPTLFLVEVTGSSAYQFTLFDMGNNVRTTQTADLSTTGWDVTLGASRFSGQSGSDFIYYNPTSGEIIFALFPAPAGEGGWKPANARPDPPFRFAVYKTSFETQNQFTQLYAETAETIFVTHMLLNPHDNSLLLDVDTLGETRRPQVLKFELGTGRLEDWANTAISFSGKELAERSDLRLSPDGQKLYQLLLYGDPQKWTNETLYLKTINLAGRVESYQEVITGDNIQYSILALSADGNNVAYYTMSAGQYHLWVKDLASGNVKSIPLAQEVGNLNLIMSDDGKRILVGFKEGPVENTRYYWEIYDLNSAEYQSTPLAIPLAWDSSGRNLAGVTANAYIVFDIQTSSEVIIAPLEPSSGCQIQAAQWR